MMRVLTIYQEHYPYYRERQVNGGKDPSASTQPCMHVVSTFNYTLGMHVCVLQKYNTLLTQKVYNNQSLSVLLID